MRATLPDNSSLADLYRSTYSSSVLLSECAARGWAELAVLGDWPALEFVVREWRALALTPMARGLALVWGLIWASFANVVIYRLPHEQSLVKGGSRCGSCGEPVRWFDNIPVVSYLLLRGQCRACGTKFSARYMVVELIGGVVSLALYMKFVVAPLLLASDPRPRRPRTWW